MSRYFVDASSLFLPKLWTPPAGVDVVWPGHKDVPFDKDADDVDWIPWAAKNDRVSIQRDRRVRTRPGEIDAILESKIRVLRFGGKKDQSPQAYVDRLVRLWPDIEDFVERRKIGPWYVSIDESGLNEKPLGRRRGGLEAD